MKNKVEKKLKGKEKEIYGIHPYFDPSFAFSSFLIFPFPSFIFSFLFQEVSLVIFSAGNIFS